MGIKRPLEEEDLAEPSFKQPNQLDHNKRLTLHAKESQITTVRVDSPDGAKSNFCKLQFDGQLEDGGPDSTSLADKELEASVPLSLVTSSSSEEDARNGDTCFPSYFPGYIDFSIPRVLPEQYQNLYLYLLNSSPRKEVPIGLDHQAEIPKWDPNASGKDSSGPSYSADKNREQRLMGTCIIPVPDLNDPTMDEVRVGRGRTDCSCLDVGSMRCVQQHIQEQREKLRETIGDKKFTELGFYDMGEEVSRTWTPHDEDVFHNIVFSNPASDDNKFWKHLRAAFPNRTLKELVSYYFNVFMLHRRAVQNRSYLLEIDSDDDEQHEERKDAEVDTYQTGSYSVDPHSDNDDDRQGPDEKCYLVGGEEEDSTIESFGQDMDASWVDDFWSAPENVGGDEGNNPNHGTSSGSSNVEKQQDAVEMDGRTEKISGEETEKLHNDFSFDS